MREAYKKSSLGKIPANWDIKSLEDLKEVGSTISYGVVQPGPEDLCGVRFVRGGDIKNGKINENLRTITDAVSNSYSRTLLK